MSGAPASDDETSVLPSHDDPTYIKPEARHRVAPPTAGGSTTINSPIEALERDEMLRTRRFCVVGMVIGLVGGLGTIILPGDPTATMIVLAAVGVALVALTWIITRTGDPVKYRHPATGAAILIPALAVTSSLPFYGVFSPAPVVLVLGIYFISLGKSGRLAIAVYTIAAGMQGVLSALIIFGAIRDPGLIHASGLSTRDQVITQLIVQAVLLGTLVTARLSRKTALAAVGELERAVRTSAHKEALLLEAREELERALRSGRGRFTDQTLGGYHLGTVLGRGAMGEVYGSIDPRSKQPVAVKLLSQASLANTNHVMRFLRELRTAATINSPNVVRVLEVGEQPVPYLVMEKLEGQTLAEILRTKRALPGGDVLDMVRQIGAGITAAAAANIVHRDLKPQNVFLDHGTWKVLDFGIARAIDAGDTLTAGHIVGTPSYMAPEQAGGGTVDHCSDLYALAAIAYRALTGHPPYAGGEIAETLYRVVHTSPRKPSELVESLDSDALAALDCVLAIGLAKKPKERFGSAAEFAEALGAALGGALPAELVVRGENLLRAGAFKSTTARTRAKTAR